MANIITLLLITLLPLLAAGQEPLPCVFPFTYKKKVYNSCTTDDTTDGQPWCSTTSNYDQYYQWKPCSVKEYGGNSDGKPCVFPFVYQRKIYYTCTNKFESKGRFWCATTGNYDLDKQWSYCADTRIDDQPTGPCVFPFIYKGTSYPSCTTEGTSNGELWCSLTKNYDMDPKWTYCTASEPHPCVFPFIYNARFYSSCTKDGATDGQLWCATTSNYDINRKWKTCSLQEYGGNSKGQLCFFPFIYKNQTYNACTEEDEMTGKFWCATTENYDEDGKWSYCADTRQDVHHNGQQCAFPFRFKGKFYLSCTTDGTITRKPWCSLTRNYDADRQWKYCKPADFPEKCSHPQ